MAPYAKAVAEIAAGEAASPAGFYDGQRTFKGTVFKLREHLERLYSALKFARIDPGLGLDQMEAATLEVLDANTPSLPPDGDFTVGQILNVKPMKRTDGPATVDVFIYCQAIDFSRFARGYASGVRITTPSTYAVPAGTPGEGEEAHEVQQTLLLEEDENGGVASCGHANFMFVREGRVKLPDRSAVQPGISMETALELAESLGMPVDEGRYFTGDVYASDEAFVTDTRSCLLPVATVNGLSIGKGVPGPITGKLLSAWSEMVGVDIVQQASIQRGGPGTVSIRLPD